MEGSFIFYGSWAKALKRMPAELKVEAYEAIAEYGCSGEIDLETLNPWVASVLEAIIPQIDANEKRRADGMKGAAHGAKGGRPKKNPTGASEETPQGLEGKPQRCYEENTTGVMSETPNVYVDDNVDDNVDVNVDVDVNDDVNKRVAQVVDYLNQVTGSKYKASTDATKRHIKARLNDGYGFDDFKAVIDKKAAQWMGGDMEKYLRPETLFGSKFESYLNEREAQQRNKNPFLDYTHKTNYDLDALERKLTENPRLVAND